MAQKILVIGAGAAGMAAAGKLCEEGFDVSVIEARDRPGGRVFTTSLGGMIEAGAEFIHGKLQTTLSLLRSFGIDYEKLKGEWYKVSNGFVEKTDVFIEDYKLLEKHLKELKEDITVEDFLHFHFPGDRYEKFRKSVLNFVEGYDAADAAKASTLHFREEWMKDDDSSQYRIKGGYGKLINAMVDDFNYKGGKIIYNSVVIKIKLNRNSVEVITDENKNLRADKIIVTLPPPLIYDHRRKGAINFEPAQPEIVSAFSEIGYGAVIKIFVRFETNFWEQAGFENLGWILSDEDVPTWWTQLPSEFPLLTGWLAGPAAEKAAALPDGEILDLAFKSLGGIFSLPVHVIRSLVNESAVYNWKKEPYSAGAYSYATVNRMKLLHQLNLPVNDMLFFAGEALESENTGTVDAAFVSGFKAAGKVIQSIINHLPSTPTE